MTAELCTQVEVDPGTEKAEEKAAEEERLYKLRMDGTDAADVTEKITDAVSSVNVGGQAGNGYAVFDIRA